LCNCCCFLLQLFCNVCAIVAAFFCNSCCFLLQLLLLSCAIVVAFFCNRCYFLLQLLLQTQCLSCNSACVHAQCIRISAQHHTVQHSMVLCILYSPARLLTLMLTHRHQSLHRCQRDNCFRYAVYTACHALSPRASQSPECVQAKKQSLQVCCTVLVMLCGLQRAAKNKNDIRRRAADMPSSCWDNRGVLGIYRSVPTKQVCDCISQSRQVETHPIGRRQRRNPHLSLPCA